jgi:hypothetical protein
MGFGRLNAGFHRKYRPSSWPDSSGSNHHAIAIAIAIIHGRAASRYQIKMISLLPSQSTA